MNDPSGFDRLGRGAPGGRGLDRRQVLRLAALLGAGAVAGGAVSGCAAVPAKPDPNAPQKSGGELSHGATGGGLKDTLDPHFPVTNPDIARCNNLYEPLFFWDSDYLLAPALATAITPNKEATRWTVDLRRDVVFHHGKTMEAEDVLFTLGRLIDPENPAPGGADLATILDLKNSRMRGRHTLELQLKQPYAALDQLLAEYTTGIIPTDFDPKNPVGTGPFSVDDFKPGQFSDFARFDDYWGDPAWVERLFIYDFADDAAKVNALLAGQVQSVDNLPNYLAGSIEQQGSSPLISESGAWVPFTIRVDAEPFKDVRVRQALRMVVDRQQMIDQALSGYGTVANDLYAPFDPAYADDLPQRTQDIDQAKSLLKQAGHPDLQVTLVTSSAVGAGGVESANLFVEQARLAGIDVALKKVDPNTFYGEQYLSWPFAQDFWNTRNYIPQVAACALKGSPYNETHFNDEEFVGLFNEARRETDEAKRADLLHRCQEIEYERGGYIIWGFKKQVDAYSNLVQGFKPSRYMNCGSFKFQRVSFV